MKGIKLSHELAEEALGLEAVDGRWCRFTHPTGWLVASCPVQLPRAGYFRPDRSLWQLKIVALSVPFDVKYRGNQMIIRVGKSKEEVEWSDLLANHDICEVILKEARRRNVERYS